MGREIQEMGISGKGGGQVVDGEKGSVLQLLEELRGLMGEKALIRRGCVKGRRKLSVGEGDSGKKSGEHPIREWKREGTEIQQHAPVEVQARGKRVREEKKATSEREFGKGKKESRSWALVHSQSEKRQFLEGGMDSGGRLLKEENYRSRSDSGGIKGRVREWSVKITGGGQGAPDGKMTSTAA